MALAAEGLAAAWPGLPRQPPCVRGVVPASLRGSAMNDTAMPDVRMPSAARQVTLAGNTLLARQLREEAALQRRDAGERVWETPEIYAIEVWIRRLWIATWPQEQQLHPVQELALCEQLIARDPDASQVLSRTELARALRRSLSLCEQFHIRLTEISAGPLEQSRLVPWRAQVEAELKRFGGLLNAQLEQAARRAIEDGLVELPERIRFVGNRSALLPSQRAVLEACAARGVEIEWAPRPQGASAEVRCLSYADTDAMWLGVAGLCRDRLQAARAAGAATPRILLAVNNEEQERPAIEAALLSVLSPELLLDQAGSGRSRHAVPWRFAMGLRLSAYPLVAAALQAMRWSARSEDPDMAVSLLTSPIFFGGKHAAAAAALDAGLRRAGGDRVSLTRMIAMAERQGASGAAVHARLTAFQAVLLSAPGRALPSEWVAHLDQRLAALGWPGLPETQDSETYQEMEQWREAMAAFIALDAQVGQVSQADASRLLRETVSTRRFTPRVKLERPIEVVSFDEIEDLRADLIIMAGLTDNLFPRPVMRDAFLDPLILERARVPFASPEDCLGRARKLLEHVARQAPQVVIALPRHGASGVELSPSPLIRECLGIARPEDAAPPRTALMAAIEAAPPLTSAGEREVAVSAAERDRIRGGTAILRSTAIAPLVAFLKHRVGVDALESHARMSALVQGSITHRVLERLFAAWPGSRALRAAFDEGEAVVRERVEAEVAAVIREALPAAHYRGASIRIESARQVGVAMRWLAHECKRSEPFEVLCREFRVQLEFGGLPLELAIDRIDRVQSASGPMDLLVDYKTGRVSRAGWDPDSLTEPQLPLYGSAEVLAVVNEVVAGRAARTGSADPSPISCDGLCFSQVSDTEPKFLALTSWTDRLIQQGQKDRHGLEPDWPGRAAAWQRRLRQLVRSFLQGQVYCANVPAGALRFDEDLAGLIRAGEAPGYPLTEAGVDPLEASLDTGAEA